MSNSTAFNAKFRIVENRNRKSDKSPEQNIIVDFTAKEAVQAANYLMTMAEAAEVNNKTVRIYTGKDTFTEEVGFSLWGGLWGNKGSFSPLKPDSVNDPIF
jgi:hypothetical protein